MTEFERGDSVRLEGAPEWRQPYTVSVVYMDGRLQLTDPFNADKISINPDRVTEVRDK